MLALVLSMLLVLALVPLYLWKRRQDTRPTDEHVEQQQVCLKYYKSFNLCFLCGFLIGWNWFQAPRSENVVRGGATGGGSRMHRRPAAGGASTSSSATAEGL